IAGFVVALRKGSFPWRRALRWALVLAIVPIGAAVFGWETSLFEYGTSDAWRTFLVGQFTSIARNIGLQIGLIFLAVAALDAAYPAALGRRRRAGRARFGRAALAGALAVVSLLVIREGVMELLASRFPGAATVRGFSVPQSVAISLPALLAVGQMVVRAI